MARPSYADIIIEGILCEINKGGDLFGAFDDETDGARTAPHYDPKQIEMFPDLPKDFRYVGDMGPYTVAVTHKSNRNAFTAYVFDGREKIAYVSADRSWDAYSDYPYQVKAVEVRDDYRGRGIALELYAFLLKHICTELVADESQTNGGVKLWKQMLASKRFNLYWMNVWENSESRRREGVIKRPRDLEKVYNHDGYRLICDLKTENGGSSHEDKPFKL